jgi:hypothetical protein
MLEVGRLRARSLDHLGQAVLIVKQRTRTKHVIVKRLPRLVRFEQGALQRLQNGGVMDIGVRVVDERARLDIAVGVDVHVAASAGDAAVDVLAVVPEVHRENRFGIAEFANLMIHEFALFRRHHQIGGSVDTDRHVREEPGEFRALLHHPVKIRFAADDIGVGTRVAARHAKRHLVFTQEVHRVAQARKGALAATRVGRFLEALDADGRHEVADANHLFTEVLVDQGAVREGQEHTVLVAFAERDDVVLAHHRLAARIDIEVNAELFALLNDVVQRFERHAHFVAVVRGPASDALQVARRRRIHQDRPRDVAAMLFSDFLRTVVGNDVAVDNEVVQQDAALAVIDIGPCRHRQIVPVPFFFNRIFDLIDLAFDRVVAIQFLDKLNDARDIALGIAVEHFQHRLDGRNSHFFVKGVIAHKTFPFSYDDNGGPMGVFSRRRCVGSLALVYQSPIGSQGTILQKRSTLRQNKKNVTRIRVTNGGRTSSKGVVNVSRPRRPLAPIKCILTI